LKRLILACALAAPLLPLAAHAADTAGQGQYLQWLNQNVYTLLGKVDELQNQVSTLQADNGKLREQISAGLKDKMDALKAQKAPPALPKQRDQPNIPPATRPHTAPTKGAAE
jgi:hypothetical protein